MRSNQVDDAGSQHLRKYYCNALHFVTVLCSTLPTLAEHQQECPAVTREDALQPIQFLLQY